MCACSFQKIAEDVISFGRRVVLNVAKHRRGECRAGLSEHGARPTDRIIGNRESLGGCDRAPFFQKGYDKI